MLLGNNIVGFLLIPTLKNFKKILPSNVSKRKPKENSSDVSIGVTTWAKSSAQVRLGTLDGNPLRSAKRRLTQKSNCSETGRRNVGGSGSSGEGLHEIPPIESRGIGLGGGNGGARESLLL